MKFIYLTLVALILTSCGATVATDYERDYQWSDQKTYQFYDEMKSGLNDLDDKRIIMAMDSALNEKGFQRTDYNQYFISFYVDESLSNSRNSIGIGLGTGGRGISIGGGTSIPIGGKVINQRLTIEVREATTGQSLVWQAVYDGELKEKVTPEQKEAYYNKIIPKMLKDFPPKEN